MMVVLKGALTFRGGRRMGDSRIYKKSSTLLGVFLLGWLLLLTGSVAPFALTRDPARFFFVAIAVFSAIDALFRLASALLARRLEKHLWSRRSIALACGAMSLGSVLLCFGYALPAPRVVFLVLGSCLAAAGMAFCFGVWVKCTSLMSNNAIMQEVSITFLLASVVGMLFYALPPVLTVYALFVLPICVALSAFCSISAARHILARTGSPDMSQAAGGSAGGGPARREWLRDIVLLAVGALCYGLASQFTRAEGWSGDNMAAVADSLMFHQVGIATSSLILYLLSSLASLERRSVLNDGIGGPAAIILTVGTLVPVFSAGFMPEITSAIIGAGIGLIEIYLLFYSIALTGRTKMPALLSVGITWGIMALASVAGQLLRALVDVGGLGGGQASILVPTAIAVVLFATCILIMNPTLKRLFLSLEESVITEEGIDSDLGGPEGRMPREGSTAPVAAGDPAALFERKGLTPRETEVALLLVTGRSLPYIEEELSISHGTANTHLRHIYEKLGVHNRQEFLSAALGSDDDRSALHDPLSQNV